MTFNGSEGSAIDHKLAGEWTHAYQGSVPTEATKAVFFGRQILEEILAQEDCQGIRFYFGLSSGTVLLNGQMQLVAVGANSQANDLAAAGQLIADDGVHCPSGCSQPNVLYT